MQLQDGSIDDLCTPRTYNNRAQLQELPDDGADTEYDDTRCLTRYQHDYGAGEWDQYSGVGRPTKFTLCIEKALYEAVHYHEQEHWKNKWSETDSKLRTL